jgi:hypothetical protein
MHEAPQALKLKSLKPLLFLRHDVDIDPYIAMRMAEIETEAGICATYMFMVNSRLYSFEDPSVRSVICRLISMGHEVAIHFDYGAHRRVESNAALDAVEKEIAAECGYLEAIVDSPIRSISFHRPLPQFLNGPLYVAGRVNAYARELMARYISDSRGRWREGEPLPTLIGFDGAVMQILIHPIWWGDNHMSPEARLEVFFRNAIAGLSAEQAKGFDESLGKTLGIRRSGAVLEYGNA